mmetsp:Transcript_34200/g.76997  ORF Transcript_34200/g.76997 Transcript_34200/m.76997 type:complete len:273 (+) Transcript_34200:617-1435(+)
MMSARVTLCQPPSEVSTTSTAFLNSSNWIFPSQSVSISTRNASISSIVIRRSMYFSSSRYSNALRRSSREIAPVPSGSHLLKVSWRICDISASIIRSFFPALFWDCLFLINIASIWLLPSMAACEMLGDPRNTPVLPNMKTRARTADLNSLAHFLALSLTDDKRLPEFSSTTCDPFDGSIEGTAGRELRLLICSLSPFLRLRSATLEKAEESEIELTTSKSIRAFHGEYNLNTMILGLFLKLSDLGPVKDADPGGSQQSIRPWLQRDSSQGS